VVKSAPGADLLDDPDVKAAYLGVGAAVGSGGAGGDVGGGGGIGAAPSGDPALDGPAGG
jgi:branched-chain amino acid transport system ATP-binding protein